MHFSVFNIYELSLNRDGGGTITRISQHLIKNLFYRHNKITLYTSYCNNIL